MIKNAEEANNENVVLIVAKCIVNRPDLSPYIPFSKY